MASARKLRREISTSQDQFHNLRHALWKLLEEPTSSRAARMVSVFILLVIVVAITTFMISSYPRDQCGYKDGTRECASSRLDDLYSLQTIETVCIIIFTIEYVLRLACCTTVMPLVQFLLHPLNVLDLLAILPWYLTLILRATRDSASEDGNSSDVFSVLRIVRLARVLRMVKLSRSLQGLLVLVRTLRRSVSAFMILLSSLLLSMLIFGAFITIAERGTYNWHYRQYLRADGLPSPFISVPEGMYWCMVSMTTVGYGDMYPISRFGQSIAFFCIITGIVILSVPITIISKNFDEELKEQQRVNEREKRVAVKRQQRQEKRQQLQGDATKALGVAGEPCMGMGMQGYDEIRLLLEDYRSSACAEITAVVKKSEVEFLDLVQKAVIESRVTQRSRGPQLNDDPVL